MCPAPCSGLGSSEGNAATPTQQATAPVQPGTLAGHPGLGLEHMPDDIDEGRFNWLIDFQMRKLFPCLVLAIL